MTARATPIRIVLSACLPLIAGAAQADVAPAAWWTFDDSPERLASDDDGESGDTYLGNLRQVQGVAGRALVFDGYTSALTRPAAAVPSLAGGFTVSAWLAVAAYPWNRVPLVDLSGNPLEGFSVELGSRGELALAVAVDGRRVEITSGDAAVPLRSWTQVAARFDPLEGLALFVDGEIVAERVLPAHPAGNGRPPTRRLQTPTDLDLVIGAVRSPRRAAGYHRFAGTRPGWYSLDGLLDELKIYDVALPADALAAAAEQFRPGPPELAERRLPSGPPGPGRFGAYPTRLDYYPEWDALWRVGPHPDLLVRFDQSPARVVFWRGTQYSPAWVSGNGLWMADQSVEGYDDDYTWEHMNDKQNRYSHVRLIEQSDARVVVHWRYAPVNVENELMNVEPRGQNGAWVDEYYYFYPDVSGVRHVTWTRGTLGAPVQFQESIPLAHPGQTQGEVVHDEYATVGNLAGETAVLAYVERPQRGQRSFPDDLTIQMHELRSRQKPFIVFEPGSRMSYLWDLDVRSLGRPGSSSHWPVGLLPSDGRTAQALDRATSFLGFPISEPVLHAGEDGRDYWHALYGMTERPFADLVTLARSWSRPPALEVAGAGFEPAGYSRAERSYRIERSGDADVLALRLMATEESPLVNVALVIENWGAAAAALELDGRDVARGGRFRYGHRHGLQGTDLIAWIEHEARATTSVVLTQLHEGE